jgi:hypothetical protein
MLDKLQQTPSADLLSTQEAKERLDKIVEGFFFRRLRLLEEFIARVARQSDEQLLAAGRKYLRSPEPEPASEE